MNCTAVACLTVSCEKVRMRFTYHHLGREWRVLQMLDHIEELCAVPIHQKLLFLNCQEIYMIFYVCTQTAILMIFGISIFRIRRFILVISCGRGISCYLSPPLDSFSGMLFCKFVRLSSESCKSIRCEVP